MAAELKCLGPSNSFGDPDETGVSRIAMQYKIAGRLEHNFALDLEQIEALQKQLVQACYQLAINRAKVEHANAIRSRSSEGGHG